MKQMKKLVLIVLMILLCLPAFSTTPVTGESGAEYSAIADAYMPISARTMAMGGAGVAVARGSDSFYVNPAALADRQFQISIPGVAVTIFNPYAMLTSGVMDALLKAGDMTTAATQYLGILAAQGANQAVTTDLGLSFTAGGFGLGIHAQENLHSYSADGKTTSVKLVAELNASATLGFGYRIKIIPDKFSIDLGIAVRFNYRAFNQAVDANAVLPLVTGTSPGSMTDILLKGTPLMAGWAIPIDAGLNINMPLGFVASVVARNMNGTFYMNAYPGVSNWTQELIGQAMTSDGSVGEGTKTSFKMEAPWSLDFGLGWDPSFGKVGKFIKPTLAVDFMDMVGFFQNPMSWESFLLHASVGAELRLFSFLDVRAGLNQGYVSMGVGLDLYILRVDVSYYWQEFGVQLGDKPVDSLTIRVNLGYDKK